ncbi:hypothetical protein EI94DRAFT_1813486 [Lactarius quietus]|nr:hypothetical protein EI94DRAFT_1813486 [Lactarius quietus]
MAYFDFDFKHTNKQNVRNVLRSLLTQLSTCSDSYCNILSRVYKEHNNGTYQPDTEKMIACLKEMLTLPGQPQVYIILDALDECPQTSGDPPACQDVHDLLTYLVSLRLSNLHICVTSRPEVDIKVVLEPLAFHAISIHDQDGQKKDIEDHIKSVVYAKFGTPMSQWRRQDKELVIETLTEKSDGM